MYVLTHPVYRHRHHNGYYRWLLPPPPPPQPNPTKPIVSSLYMYFSYSHILHIVTSKPNQLLLLLSPLLLLILLLLLAFQARWGLITWHKRFLPAKPDKTITVPAPPINGTPTPVKSGILIPVKKIWEGAGRSDWAVWLGAVIFDSASTPTEWYSLFIPVFYWIGTSVRIHSSKYFVVVLVSCISNLLFKIFVLLITGELLF